jgi:hypothetical protein
LIFSSAFARAAFASFEEATGDPDGAAFSPSTAAFDRTVKAHEYAATESIQAYVMLEQDRPAATVLRRSTGWQAETVEGAAAVLALPEIGLAALPLAALTAA